MNNNTRIVERLAAFKERDKFSWQAWNDKGLNPSPAELSKDLSRFFDTCVDKVTVGIEKNYSAKQFKKLLKKSSDSSINQLSTGRKENLFVN